MERQRILISGGGIAGCALATELGRQGHEVTVVERAAAPRTGGQAVDVRGVARTVVERMGLMPEIRGLAVAQRGFAKVGADGRLLARLPVEAFGGEGIVSELEILRGDLAGVLQRAARAVADVRHGDWITGLEDDGQAVTASFAHSAPRRYDLAVGADGQHSGVRALAFGPEPRWVTPLGCCTAWFTAPEVTDVGGWFLMHNAPGGRVASARPGRLPGELKAALSFRTSAADEDLVRDPERVRAALPERFAGVGWAVPALVEAAATAPDFAADALGQVRMPRWSSGRVVLVGDAGSCPSPLTGLGTSLALVGAHVLGRELAEARSHEAAFGRYEARMRPYVEPAQRLPPGGVRGYAPMSRVMIALGNASMRMMGRWPLREILVRQTAKADAMVLPEEETAAVPEPVNG
jgi:2-polyprenyl-6-methoxyphenol hydroxylase-like FAD-dependent oxidoreductase